MKGYFQRTTSAAPLAVFRIALGVLLFGSVVRFWVNGWIHELYIQPKHFFPFYGFEFVRPLGEHTYILFGLCALCAVLVCIGLFYRVAIVGLFLTFTYIELIDKSTYLNHYYFVSMVCLMMIFLPAHTDYSVDARRCRTLAANTIPRWCLDALKLFVCIVYFYAGLAKLNSDWLAHAQPLRVWLPAKNDLPLIGSLLDFEWVAYTFSWAGCLYDLFIPFLLLAPRTRFAAYIAVVVFHIVTSMLFPIGMFPYIMMATALIFLPSQFHEKVLRHMKSLFAWKNNIQLKTSTAYQYPKRWSHIIHFGFAVFLLIQLAMPWRYVLYPEELFWTEEGYRFSWRVMLMEKAGYAQFTVRDADGRQATVDNREFLTPLQEKMMSTQPDMMIQYAHILHHHFARNGFTSPEIYVDSYVAVNGRLGKPLVGGMTDLAKEKDSFAHKSWLLPFGDEIKGI